MSHVRSEVDGYQLVENDDGWFVVTPDGRELRVTTGNKVKVFQEFNQDPEEACSVHCG